MAKKKETNKKAKTVLDAAFTSEINPLREQNAREMVVNFIKEVARPTYESVNFMVDVKDPETKHWRKNEHFTKVFQFELKHAVEYYSLSGAEKHFFLDLGEFLMWQTNLLVDEENNPLNQKKIAEKLDISIRTVQRNMKLLEEKCLINKVEIWNQVFYIVNPYIMFIGQDINICIPRLFDEIGYMNSSMVDSKNNRSNRKKAQQKRITVV